MIETQEILCPELDLNWLFAAQNSEMLPLGSVHFLVYPSACSCKQYIKCPHYLTCWMTARLWTVTTFTNRIWIADFNNNNNNDDDVIIIIIIIIIIVVV
jgi:hypothetical protein